LALEKPIINVGIISCALIFLGLFTEIELFRSYNYSNRFGFNGVFLKTSEASYNYMCFIAIALLNFFLKKKSVFLFLLFAICSLLIGTKVIWLFIILAAFLFYWNNHKKLLTLFSVLIITVYFSFRKQINVFLIQYLPNGEALYRENKMITVFTSTRDLLLKETLHHVIQNWNPINYFFGGNKYWLFKVELEFFDLFFLFGFLGLAVHFFFLKDRFFKKKSYKYTNCFIISIFICAFFAGNFFKSFLSFTIFYITFELINAKIKINNTQYHL